MENVYVAVDGDSIGQQVGRAVLADDDDALHDVSKRIDSAQALITQWIKDNGGRKISGGGDEATMSVPKEAVGFLEELRKDIEHAFGFTISVGIGNSLSEAGKALLIAKLQGKNRVVTFGKEIEEEIKRIKSRAKKGAMKSMEEFKLTEAYLKKGEATPQPKEAQHEELSEENCPYCQQTDGVDPDHCKYCHDAEAKQGEEACPYCHEDPSMGAEMPEVGEEDCQYCKEKDATAQESCPYCKQAPASLVSPDSNNEFAPAGSEEEKAQYDKMGMNPPIIGKPDPSKEAPIGQNAPMDVEPGKPNGDPIMPEEGEPAGKSDPRLDGGLPQGKAPFDPEDTHSREALTAIADQIKEEGTPTESSVDAIGDENLPTGNSMEGNVSHPVGFEQNTPADTGLGGPNAPSEGNSMEDEEPDLADVLEEGLDHHAEGIQREKTIQVVSQALVQFQAAKPALEAMQMQNPQLYQACVGILKAMIEMASMLGLGPSAGMDNSGMPQNDSLGQTDSNLGEEQNSLMPPQEEQNDEWHDPFPAHPDHGGEQKPGHAPPSKPKPEGPASPQR